MWSRITPACAGKSRFPSSKAPSRRDHPRVCGEKFALRNMMNVNQGSPPRVRGKEQSETGFCSSAGITPAYAGKSGGLPCRVHRRGDHPRVCGEKAVGLDHQVDILGSPPRMRGKEKTPVGHLPDLGITPAHAGKRSVSSWAICPAWDHPRVCGEKVILLYHLSALMGSPPRMRGKEERRKARETGLRITPAYAGKRMLGIMRTTTAKDHPRVCGEK